MRGWSVRATCRSDFELRVKSSVESWPASRDITNRFQDWRSEAREKALHPAMNITNKFQDCIAKLTGHHERIPGHPKQIPGLETQAHWTSGTDFRI